MSLRIVADKHIPLLEQAFAEDVELELIAPDDFCFTRIQSADVIIVRSRTNVTTELLANTSVKLVASPTSGVDHIDQSALAKLNIQLIDAKGCNAPAVSEYILAVIAWLRQQKKVAIHPLTMGIIGVGHVGSLVSHQLNRLGYNIIQCDPLRAEAEPDFKHTPIEQIQQCDIVSLHVPFTREGRYITENFITEKFIRAQKPNAVIINSARGEVISLAAIEACLTDFNFVFDVFPNEPNFDRRYLECGLLTTPHIAGNALESKTRGGMMVADKICDFFNLSKQKLQKLKWPQGLVIPMKKDWEKAVLEHYNPFNDHLALQEIKGLSQEEFAKRFNALRELRALRREALLG